jgi:3-isopropylmalate/(R)-2-methylmalate dehydratase small subunit
MIIRGRAWKLGDNVDTDQLLPGRYLSLTDPQALASHCLEDVIPDFHRRVRPGDIIVAGSNLGCGSSREHAPTALKALGISCLVASSYARIFFRNCINLGLPAITSPEAVAAIEDGDEVRIDLETGEIENLTRPYRTSAPPLAPFMVALIEAGGLVGYVRDRLGVKMPGRGDEGERD